jgi:hypothetical protein
MQKKPNSQRSRTTPPLKQKGAPRRVNPKSRVLRSRFRDEKALRVCGALLLQGFLPKVRRG